MKLKQLKKPWVVYSNILKRDITVVKIVNNSLVEYVSPTVYGAYPYVEEIKNISYDNSLH